MALDDLSADLAAIHRTLSRHAAALDPKVERGIWGCVVGAREAVGAALSTIARHQRAAQAPRIPQNLPVGWRADD